MDDFEQKIVDAFKAKWPNSENFRKELKPILASLRAISLPKGERPKRPTLWVCNNSGHEEDGMQEISESMEHFDKYVTLQDYLTLESYADQLEAKLNGGK